MLLVRLASVINAMQVEWQTSDAGTIANLQSVFQLLIYSFL